MKARIPAPHQHAQNLSGEIEIIQAVTDDDFESALDSPFFSTNLDDIFQDLDDEKPASQHKLSHGRRLQFFTFSPEHIQLSREHRLVLVDGELPTVNDKKAFDFFDIALGSVQEKSVAPKQQSLNSRVTVPLLFNPFPSQPISQIQQTSKTTCKQSI